MSTPAPPPPPVDEAHRRVLAMLNAHWQAFLLQGILMVILGMLAVAVPNLASIGIELLIGWLFIIGGLVRAAVIIRKHLLPGRWWSLISSALAVAIGALLIARPLQGVMSLTLLLAALFVIEGVAAVFVALEYRRYLRSWAWTLFSGGVNLVLAYLIWQRWPNSATWIIGLLVGINLIFIGISLIMSAVAARRLQS